MIPKIIFQTHENSYIDLEKYQKTNSSTWFRLNPEYEYIYMGSIEREHYVKKLCPELYEIYKQCDGIYQSDIWRYVMLYNYGGVYADMDSVCIKPLDSLFYSSPDSEIFITDIQISPWTNSDFVNNSNFACIKKSDILKLTIETIINQYKNYLKYNNKKNYIPVNECFSNIVLQNKENVNFKMRDFIMHCYTLKETSWLLDDKHVTVNFNGNILSFNDFFILYKNFLDKVQ